MAIVFPTSPTLNDTFTEGSITYKCVQVNPNKWIGLGVTPGDRLVEGSNSLEINASNELVWTGGDAKFGGAVEIGASLDLTDSTVDLYSQTTNSSSKTFQLFSDIGGTKVEKAFIQASGNANFSGHIITGNGVFSNEFFSNTQTNDDSTSNIAFRPRNAAGGSPAASLRVGVSGQCYIPAGGVTYAMRVGHDTGTTYASGEHGYIAFGGAADDFVYMAARNVADGTPIITADVGGTRQFEIEADGDMFNRNNVYGQTSDIKLKENIIDSGSQWDDIKALRVRKFNFKAELGYDPKTQIGFIAQEVEEVSPGLVKTNPDKDMEGNDLGTETKVLRMSIIHVKAVKALQEAMARIEDLEARLSDAGL